ncbi:MAG: hypothetical protein IPO88_02040 [Nannocystis sp.]|uniref:hypothetical protein n=1 Tax=Nannocystis sp. TaxID=1962667 RepID=UPI002426FE1B|nr:hypothetical protein [Nannocystis sp.]MBK9752282.1 hypothetical protein [Nannocystis sp.]
MTRTAAPLLLLALACAPQAASETATSESSAATTQGLATSATDPSSEAATSTPTTTATGETTATTTATSETTGAPCQDPETCPPICDTRLQNCPKGQKCTGIKPGLDTPYIGTACVPDNAGAGAPPGALCFTGADGQDTCDPASMCVQFGTGEGACLPFCAGPANAPTCADPALVCANIDHLWPIALCVPPCDPLAYDCPDAGAGVSVMACAPASVGFGCVLRGNLDAAAPGEPCDDHRDCSGPALCAPPERVFGCDHPNGCCAAYCDLGDPASCPPGPGDQLCVPYYAAPRDAPPSLADLGLCTLP